MYFSKKFVFLGFILCAGSLLAMDQPKNELSSSHSGLHSYLLFNAFSTIHTRILKGANVNEKNKDGKVFVFSLLDKISTHMFNKRRSQETLNNIAVDHAFKCLQLVIQDRSFNPNEKDEKGRPFFCCLLDTIDYDYYKELNDLMATGNYSDTAYSNDCAKNLYQSIELLMHHPKFNPNLEFKVNVFGYQRKSSFLLFWLHRMNELYGYEHAKLSLLPADEMFILEGLLDRGANVNVSDHNKDTALHYITRRDCVTAQNLFATERNLKVAEALLVRGANPNCENQKGQLPLDFCFDDTTMVPLLLLFEAKLKTIAEITNPFVQQLLQPCGQLSNTAREELNANIISAVVKNNGQQCMLNLLQSRETLGRSITTKKNSYVHTAAITEYMKAKNYSYEAICERDSRLNGSSYSDSIENYSSTEDEF